MDPFQRHPHSLQQQRLLSQPQPPPPPVLCYCRVHGTMGPLSQQQQQQMLLLSQQQQQQQQLSRMQQERLLAFHRRAAGAEREILGGGQNHHRTHHPSSSSSRQKSLPPQFADDSAIGGAVNHEHRKHRHHHHHHYHTAEDLHNHQRRHYSVSETRLQQQQQLQQKPPPHTLAFQPSSQESLKQDSLSRNKKNYQQQLIDPPSTFKSAPSSPISSSHITHRRTTQQQQQQQQQHRTPRYNAAVMAAVARAHSAKKSSANSTASTALDLPHFVNPDGDRNGEEDELPSPALETSIYAGCCGGKEPFMLIRRRPGNNVSSQKLGGSYSALDASSSEGGDEEDCHDCAQQQKTVSECVRSVMGWVSAVGGRVNRGTAALLDAIPNPIANGGRDDFHVVMVGLDSAGKTTVLYRLKFDQYVNTAPTIGFNCERVRAPVTVETGGTGVTRMMTFQVWDVGGQEKVRPLWRPYTRATDAIVFVVDSCDKDRLEEAKLELHRIMRTPDNAAVPVLLVANKQDLPGAQTPKQLEQQLQAGELRQLWAMEAVCAVTGEGLDSAVEKLHSLIVKRRKLAKRARNKTR